MLKCQKTTLYHVWNPLAFEILAVELLILVHPIIYVQVIFGLRELIFFQENGVLMASLWSKGTLRDCFIQERANSKVD